MERKGYAMETCVYIRRQTDRATDVLLSRPMEGFNVSKWVPLGSTIELASSPFDTASKDLASVGLLARPQMCGLVTEVSIIGGWQNLLFIYVVSASGLWEPILQARMELRWFSLDSIANLDLPQADRHFDLRRMFKLDGPLVEGRANFDAGGVLIDVEWYGGDR